MRVSALFPAPAALPQWWASIPLFNQFFSTSSLVTAPNALPRLSSVGRKLDAVQTHRFPNTSVERCHYSSSWISRAKQFFRKTVSLFVDELCELKFQHERHVGFFFRVLLVFHKFTEVEPFLCGILHFYTVVHRFHICDSLFWQFSLIIVYLLSVQSS